MTEAIDTYMAGRSCQFKAFNEKSHPRKLFEVIAGLANIMHSKLSTMYRKSQLLDLMAKFSDTQGYQFLHTGFEDGIDFFSGKLPTR